MRMNISFFLNIFFSKDKFSKFSYSYLFKNIDTKKVENYSEKELSLCHKLKCSNPFVFETLLVLTFNMFKLDYLS